MNQLMISADGGSTNGLRVRPEKASCPLNYGGLSYAGKEVLGSFLFLLPSKPARLRDDPKDSSKNKCVNFFVLRSDCGVPLAVEVGAQYVETCHFLVGYDDPFRI